MTTVFTGHRIDVPGRDPPRFPPRRIAAARKWIAERVFPADVCLSSLANGGDILFAERSWEVGAIHHIVLPFAPERFIESSVRTDAPGDWVARFRAIWDATPDERRHVLRGPGDQDYDACNRALIAIALKAPAPRRLLAIWDGRDSGKPGGTSSMIALARAAGFDIATFDPRPPA